MIFPTVNDNTASVPGGRTAARRHPRLLLAKDDPSTRELLCETLRSENEVIPYTDGEQAWAAARREPPDLMLSDVVMPGSLDGIVRRLRGDPRTATVPIILLTASDEQDVLLQGLEAGADDFLHKPFRALELLARLRSRRQLGDLYREVATHRTEPFAKWRASKPSSVWWAEALDTACADGAKAGGWVRPPGPAIIDAIVDVEADVPRPEHMQA